MQNLELKRLLTEQAWNIPKFLIKSFRDGIIVTPCTAECLLCEDPENLENLGVKLSLENFRYGIHTCIVNLPGGEEVSLKVIREMEPGGRERYSFYDSHVISMKPVAVVRSGDIDKQAG